jgi:membrane-bound ClpP family serine protease
MLRRIKARPIISILLSIADEAIILTVAMVVLSQFGIHVPWWAIAIVVLIFLAYNFFAYRALRKNPQLGFENMIGKTGFAEGSVSRNGTVRIGHELWSALTKGEKIESGSEIVVVEQSGLKLVVARKPSSNDRSCGA